ncbi:uncharacterized protein LOC113362790 [Papaver somniferum]|uniref:uncharacterized protein LOC113362790 n=1 Tax=Papaver somniferum TaxID=3469 RepID=UPI000E6F7E18|nr:uncharacterized protein LOC113362790 [Papaver somniferum]
MEEKRKALESIEFEQKQRLPVLSREIVKVTMVDNMRRRRIDPCTCSKSGNDSATGKQACSWHPGGIEHWQEDQRRRTNAELARRLEIRRETKRREKESIRSKKIRCCSTSLLGEAL